MFTNSESTPLPTLLGMATTSEDPLGAPDLGQVAEDLLATEPAVLSGALIGYARVSTKDPFLDRQITALTEAGCIRIFADKKSGKSVEREELWKALDYLREGDTLVVPSLDRLGRSLQDLIAIVAGLRKRGIGFRSLKEALDTTTPGGRLVSHVFAALAEFIRELIIEGTSEGLAAAKARGQRLGRPPVMTPEQVGHARALLASGRDDLLHRPAAGRQPLHDLQVPARAQARRPSGHRGPRSTRRTRSRLLTEFKGPYHLALTWESSHPGPFLPYSGRTGQLLPVAEQDLDFEQAFLKAYAKPRLSSGSSQVRRLRQGCFG